MVDGQNMTVESVGGDISNDNQSTWVTGPIPYVDGQSFVRAQVTSSAIDGQTEVLEVTVNGVSSTFSVTTVDPGEEAIVISGEVISEKVISPLDGSFPPVAQSTRAIMK